MKTKLTKQTKGFTIIEVMIVLAIAGLILAIIFLAVPALQRNSRNTQRNSDATHLGGIIETYISNNNGQNPGFILNAATPASPVNSTVYIGGDTFTSQADKTLSVWSNTTGAGYSVVTAPAAGVTVPPIAIGGIAVYTKAACAGNPVSSPGDTSVASGTGMVLYYYLEASGGNIPHCIQV